MKEMHYFKESQREAIPSPDFRDNVTLKHLLQFLYPLNNWEAVAVASEVSVPVSIDSM